MRTAEHIGPVCVSIFLRKTGWRQRPDSHEGSATFTSRLTIARLVGTTCLCTRLLNLRLSLVSYHFQIDLPSYGMLFSQLCPTYAPCPCQNLKKVFTKLLLDSPKYISYAVADVNRYTWCGSHILLSFLHFLVSRSFLSRNLKVDFVGTSYFK